MPVVHCDAEGKVLKVIEVTGDPFTADRRPPPNTAFHVGVPDEVGIQIRKAPTLWRFAGPNPQDGICMWQPGKDPQPELAHAATDEVSAAFTKVVAAKNEIAAMFARQAENAP